MGSERIRPKITTTDTARSYFCAILSSNCLVAELKLGCRGHLVAKRPMAV